MASDQCLSKSKGTLNHSISGPHPEGRPCTVHSQFEQGLVERPGEEGVEQVLVHQGQAEQAAAEPEPLQVVVHERRQRRDLQFGSTLQSWSSVFLMAFLRWPKVTLVD